MHPNYHRQARRVTVLLLGLAALSATALPVAHAAPGMTERVSVASDGTQANNISGRRGAPAASADGQVVVFDSLASNLVPGDTNAFDDIFVRDRASGTTQRVSVSSTAAQGDNISSSPAISGDGQVVAFVSNATNLVPGDTNTCGDFFPAAGMCPDVFVHDLATGSTDRVSVDSSGAQANSASTDPDISADGTTVVFFSAASNLVAGDTNSSPDILAHTR